MQRIHVKMIPYLHSKKPYITMIKKYNEKIMPSNVNYENYNDYE